MCFQKLKKLSLLLCYLLCLQFYCLAEDGFLDVTSDFLETSETTYSSKTNNSQSKQNFSNSNLQNESKNASNSNDNLETLDLESMNAWELLENLDKQLVTLQTQVETLEASSQNLESELLTTKIELTNSINSCKQLKQALLSNKDDTSAIIQQLGELQEKIEKYQQYLASVEKRLVNNAILVNVTIVAATITPMVFGAILMGTNNDLGKPLFYTTLGCLAGFGVVYNGGHFLFKVW